MGSQLMAARRALAAVVERGIPLGRHAGSDHREVAVVPRALVGRIVAAGQVHLSSLFAGREVDFEPRFVAAKDDRIGSDDRSREEVRPGDDQRVLDKVKLLRRLIQDVAAQVPLEPNHFGESLDQAGWGGLLRVDDCLASEIDSAAMSVAIALVVLMRSDSGIFITAFRFFIISLFFLVSGLA